MPFPVYAMGRAHYGEQQLEEGHIKGSLAQGAHSAGAVASELSESVFLGLPQWGFCSKVGIWAGVKPYSSHF